jgi:hypothetical protein
MDLGFIEPEIILAKIAAKCEVDVEDAYSFPRRHVDGRQELNLGMDWMGQPVSRLRCTSSLKVRVWCCHVTLLVLLEVWQLLV